MLVPEGSFHDRLEPLRKYVLDPRRYAVKVYAKGCDAPGCTCEAEVDRNLGRPAGWYFVSVDGGSIPQGLKRTLIVCASCMVLHPDVVVAALTAQPKIAP